jgi:hypothetical protein
MAINKVTLNGVTQMDVTDDTVAPSNLLTGYQATGSNGQKVQGAVNGLVPAGGTAGQVLKKNSATDYDMTWGEAGGGGAFIITVTQINYTTNGYSLPTELQTSAAFMQAIIDARNADKPIIVQYVPLGGSYAYKDSKPYYFAGEPYSSQYYFVNPSPRYDGSAEVCIINTNSTNCSVVVTTQTLLPSTFGVDDTNNILMRRSTGLYWGKIESNDSIGYLRIDGDTNDGAVYWENVPSSISYDIASVFDDGIAQKILNKLCIYDTDTIYTNSYTARPYVLKRAYTTYDYDNENYEPGECERAVLEFEQVEHNYNSHTTTYRRILLVGIMWQYYTLGQSTPFSFTADPMYSDFFARYYVDTV